MKNNKLLQYKKNFDRSLINVLKIRLRAAKTRAIEKNLEFNIDLEYLLELYYKQKGLCFHTGSLLSLLSNKFYTISIDRLNNNLGYIKGNVVLTYVYFNKKKGKEHTKDYIENHRKIIFNYDNFHIF